MRRKRPKSPLTYLYAPIRRPLRPENPTKPLLYCRGYCLLACGVLGWPGQGAGQVCQTTEGQWSPMPLQRFSVPAQRATAALLVGALGTLVACQSESTGGSSRSPRHTTSSVAVPSAPSTATRCEAVKDGTDSATSGGVIAGPFPSLQTAAQDSGIAKFWVASVKQPREPEDAVIKVEVADAGAASDPALYVRAANGLVTVTPSPTNGIQRIYNGTIFVPSEPDTNLRITVTIGEATGCFTTHLY
jgi:hypothetical protein